LEVEGKAASAREAPRVSARIGEYPGKGILAISGAAGMAAAGRERRAVMRVPENRKGRAGREGRREVFMGTNLILPELSSAKSKGPG